MADIYVNLASIDLLCHLLLLLNNIFNVVLLKWMIINGTLVESCWQEIKYHTLQLTANSACLYVSRLREAKHEVRLDHTLCRDTGL